MWVPVNSGNRSGSCSENCGFRIAQVVGFRIPRIWKSKCLYRYRPEGIFRIFFGLILDPPGTYAFTAKKGKFICTGHFFPHGMAFLEKRGGLVPVYVFIFPENGTSNSPELSESSENGLFTPRAFFLKLGWSPGFWRSLGGHLTIGSRKDHRRTQMATTRRRLC